jgi:hypothetical protein
MPASLNTDSGVTVPVPPEEARTPIRALNLWVTAQEREAERLFFRSKGEPLKKVPTEQLVDELFKEIDRYYAAGKTAQRDEGAAAEARRWLEDNEDATAMTRADRRARSGGGGERCKRRRGAVVDARARRRRRGDRRGGLARGGAALQPKLAAVHIARLPDPFSEVFEHDVRRRLHFAPSLVLLALRGAIAGLQLVLACHLALLWRTRRYNAA